METRKEMGMDWRWAAAIGAGLSVLWAVSLILWGRSLIRAVHGPKDESSEN